VGWVVAIHCVRRRKGQPARHYAASNYARRSPTSAAANNLYGLFQCFGPSRNPPGGCVAAIWIFITALLEGKQLQIFGEANQSCDFV
jgi:hypothetical protein